MGSEKLYHELISETDGANHCVTQSKHSYDKDEKIKMLREAQDLLKRANKNVKDLLKELKKEV